METKQEVDKSHGSPFDRGGADFWYWRPRSPHWYPNGTYNPPRIDEAEMTPEQVAAYHAGYDEAEEWGERKDWG